MPAFEGVTETIRIYIVKRCKSMFLHSSPSLVEIEWTRGQRWIIQYEIKTEEDGCEDREAVAMTVLCYGTFYFHRKAKRTNVNLAVLKRDTSTVMVRGDAVHAQSPLRGVGWGYLSNPYSICLMCHSSILLLPFLSSCPLHSLLILHLLLAEWEGWGLRNRCMANSSRRGRRWDAALM